MASPAARAVVQRLQAGGLSLAQIGRALDRDSGLMSQIALDKRGAGYGSGLVGPLQALERRLSTDTGLMGREQLQRGARIAAETGGVEAPRRRTKTGQLASVRAGVRRAGPKDARVPGLYTKGTASGNLGALGSVLSSADSNGQQVYISVTFSDGKRVGLGSRTPDEWRDYGVDFDAMDDMDWDDVLGELQDAGEVGAYESGSVAGWTASAVAVA